jgi:outer membrane lipoprotein-sorting protein
MKWCVAAGVFLFIAILPVLSFAAAFDAANSPEDNGLAIAEEAERRDEGFGDMVAEVTMQLASADGRIRTRRLTWRILEPEAEGEGEKSLALFHEPRDIAGTAFLSFTHIAEPDDQWLYLPSLKRVKRISAASKSSSFVGSEFAYEDLLSDEVEKFDYRWIRDEECGDLFCFVVERRPRYENSGYSRQVLWIDRQEYRPMGIEFYDRKDRLLKTLTFKVYRQHLDRFWRAHELHMENHLTGKKTVLVFDTIRLRTGLGEDDFSPESLRRLR